MIRMLAAFMLLACAPCLAQSPDIAAILKSNGVPSLSFALIQNHRVIRTEALGEQSPGIRATPAMLYNIASLTKPLTAEILLRMASAGAFGLDDKMSPAFVDPDVADDPRSRLLTPRLALTHQTGFPNWRGKEKLKFLRDPGAGYGYSGEGYQYVAHFAGKEGRRQLRKSGGSLSPSARPPAKHGLFVGQPWFDGRIAVPTDTNGNALQPNIAKHFIAADLVYTTAGDYARFMLSVLKNKRLTREILPAGPDSRPS